MSHIPPPPKIDWSQVGDVLTVEEAGEILRISKPTAYRAVHSGSIPAVKIAGRLRVPKGRLMRLLGYEPAANGVTP